MKKCFVIMPYGGEDEKRRKHFSGVYQSIIEPAARLAGYEPKRSDIAGEPGNITHDIIRDLAGYDIVIADLTDANANVFFELGIRHTCRKSGTVHIVDESHSLPFDVSQYRAVKYSTELSDIHDTVESIANAIRRREENTDRADNPVHDALPQLPRDIFSTSDAAMQQQLTDLQDLAESLTQEKEELTNKLAAIDPSGDLSPAVTEAEIDELLDNADKIMKSTGKYGILKLRKAINDGGPEQFAEELRVALRSPYLDDNDYAEIVKICKEADLDEHRRATLELARKRHPNSEEVLLMLVDALDDSPNPADQERARVMIEQYLEVVHEEQGPRLSKGQSDITRENALMLLFSLYDKAKRPEWALSILDSLSGPLAESAVVARSRGRILAELGRSEEAEKTFLDAIAERPKDDSLRILYSNFLTNQRRIKEAYEQAEQAILADPDDSSNYFHLAIFIFNEGFLRDESGAISGPVDRASRVRAIVPLVIKATESPSQEKLAQAIQLLVRADAVDQAQAVAEGRMPSGDFDTGPLDYVLQMISD